MQDFLANQFVNALVVSGGAAGLAHLAFVVIKALLAKLQANAAKTASPLDDAALSAVEVVLDSTEPVLEKTLGKK
jgi:hypothetical protein